MTNTSKHTSQRPTLGTLKHNVGAKKRRKLLGRGPGSGLGKTCGKGTKGQAARSGAARRRWHEGGQLPLYRKLPIRGFNSGRFHKEYTILNLDDIAKLVESGVFKAGDELSPATLVKHRVLSSGNLSVSKVKGLKILGTGELTTKLNITAHAFSESAKEKLEAMGAKLTVLHVDPA